MVNPRRKNSIEVYQSDKYFEHEDYYYDYAGNKAAYQKGFRSKLKLICEHRPQKGKLLDVGAAYGFFMEEANRFGFHACGVELAPNAARRAGDHGEVFRKPLADIDTEHRFSVVCFIDSLEHFEDPLAGLRKAWDLLEVDGIVALMVPNIESTFARAMGAKWHLLLPEEHLFYFSPKSVELILKKTAFELIHLGTGSYGRSAAEIARVLLRGKLAVPAAIEKILQRISFEVNLGDIFAIAKKVGR
jgi:2-polyprenyl-3-methyl-5-hydroxy-6-metoxy-1,4-benzoquinol methylase